MSALGFIGSSTRSFVRKVWLYLLLAFCCASFEARAQTKDKATTAQAAYAQGLEALKNKNFSAAQIEFQKASNLSPRSPEPHNSLGFVLMMKGDMPAAVREFNIAIKLN